MCVNIDQINHRVCSLSFLSVWLWVLNGKKSSFSVCFCPFVTTTKQKRQRMSKQSQNAIAKTVSHPSSEFPIDPGPTEFFVDFPTFFYQTLLFGENSFATNLIVRLALYDCDHPSFLPAVDAFVTHLADRFDESVRWHARFGCSCLFRTQGSIRLSRAHRLAREFAPTRRTRSHSSSTTTPTRRALPRPMRWRRARFVGSSPSTGL